MVATLVASLKGIIFIAVTLPMLLVQYVAYQFGPKISRWPQHWYNILLCRILGLRVTVIGNSGGQGLLVANHVSWLDIPLLSSIQPLSAIAKQEVSSWPLFGWMARLQRTLFVDRQRIMLLDQDVAALKKRLRHGETLVLFPEATTHNGKAVKHFYSSFFAGAVRAPAQVIPVSIVYHAQHGLPLTNRLRPSLAWYGDMTLAPHLWAALKAGPIGVKVIFHEPLDPGDFENRKALAKEAERIVRQGLAEHLHSGLAPRR